MCLHNFCWGGNSRGQASPPAGRFSAVSAGGEHTCALRESGEIECWGARWRSPPTGPPAGRFSAVSAGYEHTCALRKSGGIACWGSNDEGESSPPAGRFSAVSAGSEHTCALRESGGIACWGEIAIILSAR